MRIVPAAIATARESEAATVCKVWVIVRRDNVVFRFTDHGTNLEIDGDAYMSVASFDPSAIKGANDLSVSDLDVRGAFDTAIITEADLIAGKYYGAQFMVGETLWDDPEAGIDVLCEGTIGNVRTVGGAFVAELLGMTVPLQKQFGAVTQPHCRAQLGDEACGAVVDEQFGIVTAVHDRRSFDVSGITQSEDDWFAQGALWWMLGANEGLGATVASFDGTTVTLALEMFSLPQVDDEFSIRQGCDHSLAMCKERFDNVLRFRGEPHKPVSDDLIKGPIQE